MTTADLLIEVERRQLPDEWKAKYKAMIDAVTKAIADGISSHVGVPCPNCGKTNLKWNKQTPDGTLITSCNSSGCPYIWQEGPL